MQRLWHTACLRAPVPFASVGLDAMDRVLSDAQATLRRRIGTAPPARLAALACLLVALAGCGRQRAMGPAGATGELPDQEVRDFALTETDQGNPEWKLYARYAAIYDARNVIIARAVRVDFYDAQGKKTSELTAREGEIDQTTRNMIARGDVVLQTTEGTRMSTDQLQYLNQKQKVISDRLVRVEREGDVLTGVGFESDPELKHFEFKRKVQAVVRTRSGGPIAPENTR
jgi:LPS export ABC transporter protein LptC